jgi:hypothetical protein
MIKWHELPLEIQEKMLQRQVEQGNLRDASVFEKQIDANINCGGFDWYQTSESSPFWAYVLWDGIIDHFYTLYQKKHITSYDELVVGQYYWIKTNNEYLPCIFREDNKEGKYYFETFNESILLENLSTEDIEPLKHE